jgi:hypothetical protein
MMGGWNTMPWFVYDVIVVGFCVEMLELPIGTVRYRGWPPFQNGLDYMCSISLSWVVTVKVETWTSGLS